MLDEKSVWTLTLPRMEWLAVEDSERVYCGGKEVCVLVGGRELGGVSGMVKWHRHLKSTYFTRICGLKAKVESQTFQAHILLWGLWIFQQLKGLYKQTVFFGENQMCVNVRSWRNHVQGEDTAELGDWDTAAPRAQGNNLGYQRVRGSGSGKGSKILLGQDLTLWILTKVNMDSLND